MSDAIKYTFFDLRAKERGDDIRILFPGWAGGDERVAILSPHDDDACLGAGYLIKAIQANHGEVFIIIACDGSAGYSKPEEKETIVATRKKETIAAYAVLGIPEDYIIRYDYPDFSLPANLGWRMPWRIAARGTMEQNLKTLRRHRITRLVVPNGYREHIDHEATYRMGLYDAPQVGDPVLSDWGLAPPIRSLLQYAVWGDFTPEDALVSGSPLTIRANRGIVAPLKIEEQIADSIRKFQSQGQIIEGLIESRQGRFIDHENCLELYLDFDPRPALNYHPYHQWIQTIE